MPNYEYKFEIRPQKFVYIPTEQGKDQGLAIISRIYDLWEPNPIFFHLGNRGGHVAAMRIHLQHRYFAKIDLSNYFNSITRTKIIRSLKKIGIPYEESYNIAYNSVVEENNRKILPYGFVQSMVLATLSFEKSGFCSEVIRINNTDVSVTIYVDDIIISSNDQQRVGEIYDYLCSIINQSNFSISLDKSQNCSVKITSFNCSISQGNMRILEDRMESFRQSYSNGNSFTREAILRYIDVINTDQRNNFLSLFDN